MNADALTLIPHISEKALGASETPGRQVVVFRVPLKANKHQIADAVAKQFSVQVADVKTIRQDGKVIRSVRKRSQAKGFARSDFKKAYVTLGPDSRIAILDEGDKKDTKKGPTK